MYGAGVFLWGYEDTGKEWLKVAVDSSGRLEVVISIDELNDIGDVNVPTPADGDCLVWDAGTSKWVDEQRAAATHASQHQNGGADEISVAGLSGLLADGQTPLAHKTSHQNGGSDEISVAGLSGLLADGQTPLAHKTSHQTAGGDALDVKDLDDSTSLLLGTDRVKDTHIDWGAAAGQVDADDVPESATKKWAGETGADVTANNAPQAHATSHQNGGGDEISVAGLSGDPADTINKSLLTTRGDLIRRGAAAPERVALGTDGYKLASDGTDAVWEADIAAIEFVIGDGQTVIPTGEAGHLEIPFACTINRVTLLADQSGSIVIDIWKDTYANFPPTDADSITASAPPTLSSAQKSQDSTLTGWTTSIAAGDILAFNVDSVSTITRVTLSLKVTKT